MPELSNIIIRKATTNDIPIIRDLVYKIWPDTYSKILSAEQIEYMLVMMYSESSLLKQFNANHICLIVEEDKKSIAFASYNKLKGTVFKLQKIYALPEQQGKGIGKMLIQYIIQQIKKDHATALMLNVNRDNKAKQFYEHLGFKVISEEDIDIGEGYFMNDYIMSYEL